MSAHRLRANRAVRSSVSAERIQRKLTEAQAWARGVIVATLALTLAFGALPLASAEEPGVPDDAAASTNKAEDAAQAQEIEAAKKAKEAEAAKKARDAEAAEAARKADEAEAARQAEAADAKEAQEAEQGEEA